jgi:phosphomannomutase
VRVSGELIGQLITIFLAAQMRGWIDLRGLEPLLRIVVESGNAAAARALLGELAELLDRLERDMTK